MFDLDSFRDFFQFYSKFLQFFNFQSEEKFSEDVLVFIFLPNFLHIFHKLFTIFTNHSLFWFQLLALWNIGDEGWNFVKKKKKRNLHLWGVVENSLLLITGPTRSIHYPLLCTNITSLSKKYLTRTIFPLKSCYELYNRESTNESLEIVKLIIFPPHSMTRWKLFNINVHNCTLLFRAIGGWLCLAQPLDDLGLHD